MPENHDPWQRPVEHHGTAFADPPAAASHDHFTAFAQGALAWSDTYRIEYADEPDTGEPTVDMDGWEPSDAELAAEWAITEDDRRVDATEPDDDPEA
ncbi:hypothetical protein AD006_31560 (plasmid) [Pseudonocardia sp. EC080610-09]|uniref:hypothetical protein n=1 Tax=unclassified Pseudonocardia TaxID=2619320 RepID=UPI000706A439|nr:MULTISPECIES: hypothetical protein [unclassified Pseudonocardia]ALL79695.1 hypothetical protein AD006_31560 [Pseudonocardia sp. EC080610-09]ALL85351.1 hypothetical protein AD017_29690 [Pseudonocardia sp. EC080619-01]